jgi:hypothetical protein
MGIKSRVSRSTLADANEVRDWLSMPSLPSRSLESPVVCMPGSRLASI